MVLVATAVGGLLGACSSGDASIPDAATAADAGSDAGPPTPIIAPDRRWTWVPFAGAQCQNGSPAGIFINPDATSDALVIVLSGGADCVNPAMCAIVDAIPISPTMDPARRSGALVRDNPSNPFANWNLVYVPYCTGDVHAGDQADETVPWITGPQQFVGWRNISRFLERLTLTYPALGRLVIMGCSSGGVGALANFPQVQRAFPGVSVTVIADSGPPLMPADPTGVHAALLAHWGGGRTLGDECGSACANPDTLFVDYFAWLLAAYPTNLFALSGYEIDTVWPGELGLSAAEFTAHQHATRATLMAASNPTGSFFVDDSNHCMLAPIRFFDATAAGIAYTDWLAAVVAVPPTPTHVGP